jgi:predicted lactoylglutathione lyase
MVKNIFVNIPVTDLTKSMDFFKKLGFTFNSQFTDETAASMVLSEHIFVMLLTYDKFKQFTNKQIADANTTTEVLIAIDADSREEVDSLVKKAVEAGGSLYAESQDYGWMYSHSFADLDGHQWEVVWMDSNKVEKQ